MAVDDDPHLDDLTRAQLAEVDPAAHATAKALDAWLFEQHGTSSSHHGVGSFLDELAAIGYRVTPIDPGPPFEQVLPASPD